MDTDKDSLLSRDEIEQYLLDTVYNQEERGHNHVTPFTDAAELVAFHDGFDEAGLPGPPGPGRKGFEKDGKVSREEIELGEFWFKKLEKRALAYTPKSLRRFHYGEEPENGPPKLQKMLRKVG